MLTIAGEIAQPRTLTFEDLAAIDGAYQVADVSRLVPGRKGDAVRLAGILKLVQPRDTARYLGLHSTTDEFHASIPLAAVAEGALVIYRLEGPPLPATAGAPVRLST